MQNAYASPGGYLDLAGFDISGAAAVIGKVKTVLDVARGAGMSVIYFQNGWDGDYVEAGGPGSPNFHKSNALKNSYGKDWDSTPEQLKAWQQAAGQPAQAMTPTVYPRALVAVSTTASNRAGNGIASPRRPSG